MNPTRINGKLHTDSRGSIKYNNDFDASLVKRIYFIQNAITHQWRGWQGHKIEKRWFAAVQGSFELLIGKVDDWNTPSSHLVHEKFILKSQTFDVLYVPQGFITCFKAIEEGSVLQAMADYTLGTINDEYRYPLHTFGITQ